MASTNSSLNVPVSNQCVNVKIIDSTLDGAFPLGMFAQPDLGGPGLLSKAYCFYIEHPVQHKKVVFDMGLRKDYVNLAPKVAQRLNGMVKSIRQNMVEILSSNGVDPASINSIVWSHAHLDHTGAPSTFPETTELVVGPGFSKKFLPGYPANPDAEILEEDYSNRTLREIDFEDTSNNRITEIGGFTALDFFGDGSFYLLDTPGHEVGHMCGLARTTPDTFIFMGGDICHHPGAFRPTHDTPLPQQIPQFHGHSCCSHSQLVSINPNKSATEPFYKIATKPDGTAMMYVDVETAYKSLEKLRVFDADNRVLVVLAHDHSVQDIIEIFPESANEWYKKGWKDSARWKFLTEIGDAEAESPKE